MSFLQHDDVVMFACFFFSFLSLSGMIKQFLRDVDWGELDYLIVDTPPGTSDEHLSIVQYLSATNVDGAVVITTPQVAHSMQRRTFVCTYFNRCFNKGVIIYCLHNKGAPFDCK